MYKMCKTEQSASRQRELEKGLLQAMNAHYYDEISVSDLCDQLGVPRKSFYRYFSGKDGALHALIDHTLLEYESFPNMLKPGEMRTHQKDLERFFLFWKEQKPLLDALERSGLSGILVERANRFALQEGHLPRQFQKMDPRIRELAMAFSVCGLMSMILHWHRGGFAVSPAEMTQLAQSILTAPLLPKQ